MKPSEIARRDRLVQEAKNYARLQGVSEYFKWSGFNNLVRKAAESAPLSEMQVNNLIVVAGKTRTEEAIGREII